MSRPLRSSPRKLEHAGILLALTAGLLAVLGGPLEANAQGSPETQTTALAGGSTKAKGKSKPEISSRPQVIGTTTTDSSSKPGRPATAGDASETARLISQFQSARTEYLEAQKELKLSSGTQSTEERRAALREQSKEALERWREQQKRYVEEQKERLQTIKSELQAEMAQRADSAGEGTGGGRDR
jgi:hypothetical protein